MPLEVGINDGKGEHDFFPMKIFRVFGLEIERNNNLWPLKTKLKPWMDVGVSGVVLRGLRLLVHFTFSGFSI